jgi:hypothetical protein
MKLTKDEILDLLDDITSAVGKILAKQRLISEDSLARQYVIDSQKKIEAIKTKLANEKDKQAKLKAVEKRKKQLEKLRTHNRRKTKVTEAKHPVRITNIRGVTIGWTRPLSNGTTVVTKPNGTLVAIQRRNKTYDAKGRYVGEGEQGACLLDS